MNKVISLIIFLVSFFSVKSQITYTPQTGAGYQFKYVKVDSGFALPFIDTSLRRGVNRIGAVVARPQDSLLYYWTGAKWTLINADVSGLLALINSKVDSVTVLGDDLSYWVNGSQTTYNLSTIAGTLNSVTTNGNTTANTIEVGKLISGSDVEVVQATFSDVLMQLVTYFGPTIGVPNRSHIRGDSITQDNEYYLADTSGVIPMSVNGYFADGKGNITIPGGGGTFDTTTIYNNLALKLNISDTAAMLGNYVNNVGFGLLKTGQLVSFDSTAGGGFHTQPYNDIRYWKTQGNNVSSGDFLGTTNNENLIIKRNSVHSGIIGESSTSFGLNSLSNFSGTTGNTAFGVNNLSSLTFGNNNTSMGTQAMQNTTIGSSNISLGGFTLTSNVSGSQNTVVGVSAASLNNSGSYNTAVGKSSLQNNVSGSNNIGLGYQAGFYSSYNPSNSLFINSLDRSTAVGDSTLSIIYGVQNSSLSNQRLRVNGKLQINDGSQGNGKVFTSDANGIGSWQTASSFTLASGSGTTAFGNAVNLGGNLTTDANIENGIGSKNFRVYNGANIDLDEFDNSNSLYLDEVNNINSIGNNATGRLVLKTNGANITNKLSINSITTPDSAAYIGGGLKVNGGVNLPNLPQSILDTTAYKLAVVDATGTVHKSFWQSGGGGISGLTTNELVYGNSATTIASLPVATYPSLTELSYVKGVTSSIQTQLNTKGDVFKVGTPSNNQIGIWTGDGTIEGVNTLTYDNTTLALNSAISGTAQTKVISANETAGTGAVNLAHFNTAQATARSTFLFSNNQSGDWVNNYSLFGVNGASFASNNYFTNIPSKTTDAGYTLFVNGGSEQTGMIIGTFPNVPLYLGTNNNARLTIAANGDASFTNDVTVPDEVYGAGWNGSLEVPTKNAIYDKIQTMGGGGDLLAANNLSDLANITTARTNLGATTLGSNFFTATNPSAIRFFRSDASNNLILEDAATFRASIGAGTGNGTVTAVNGTSNRITSTGGATPTIDISTTFENLLSKVANRIDQNNASTTSTQLLSIISDESGTGNILTTNGSAAALTSFPTFNQNTTGSAGSVTNSLSIAAELISGGATTYNGSVARSIGIQPTSVTNAMLSGSIAASKLVGTDITTIGTLSAGTVPTTLLSGTISTAQIANNSVDGTKIAMGSDVHGDLLYYNGTDYVRLAPGTSGNVLQTNGTGANPTWVALAGGGNVVNSGTPTAGQVAEWTNATTIQGISTTGTGNYVKATAPTITDGILAGELDITGITSPAQYTTDQTDVAYTGSTMVRVNTNSDARVINSISGGTSGRILKIANVGSSDLILQSDDGTTGTAANRFDFNGADVIVEPKETKSFIYDGTLQRWLNENHEYDLDILRRQPMYNWDYMLAGVSTANFATTAISAGTATYTNGVTDHPGYMQTSSSTTTNSGNHSYLYNLQNIHAFKGGEVYECIYQPRVASNTNTTTRFGFLDATTSADAVDGAYFEIPAGSFNVVGKTSNNSTRTTSATIATISVNTWYRFVIKVNRAASSISFTIYDANGVSLGTQSNTANIPTAAGREFGVGYINTNVGTTATALGWLDYQAVQLSAAKPMLR